MKINVQKNVLIAPELAHTIGVVVGSTGVTADEDGKKIIPAGTIVGGTTSALLTRDTELEVIESGTIANAQGVTVNDVDVTSGDNSVSMLVSGVVDIDKMPEDMQTLVEGDLSTAKGLSHIIFQKGDAQ